MLTYRWFYDKNISRSVVIEILEKKFRMQLVLVKKYQLNSMVRCSKWYISDIYKRWRYWSISVLCKYSSKFKMKINNGFHDRKGEEKTRPIDWPLATTTRERDPLSPKWVLYLLSFGLLPPVCASKSVSDFMELSNPNKEIPSCVKAAVR